MNKRSEPQKKHALIARQYYSGFDLAHDSYNSITAASDGRIYYVLSTQSYKEGGRIYIYDPSKDSIQFLADLDDICGENDDKTIVQGKSHTDFYERDGKLYTSTHVGFYEMIDGMERLPVNPPEGYKPYPGGHIISYDLKNKEFEDLAIAPHGEGILAMTMDKDRGQIYAISWPTGYFLHYNIEKRSLSNLGKYSANGEAGTPGKDYRVLCRSLFIDPENGAVYLSTAEGDILTCPAGADSLKTVENVNLKLDYLGCYDPAMPGSMGYNWRQIIWHPHEEAAYGVHGNSGYLFRFDPRKPGVELIDRITSLPSRKSGMYDQFSYGYLGFDLGPDEETLYYLTGGPIYIDGKRVSGAEKIAKGAAKGPENLHLVTYNLSKMEYKDHGAIFYGNGGRPAYVNSIALDSSGNIYTLARFDHNGKIIQDLVRIENPLSLSNR